MLVVLRGERDAGVRFTELCAMLAWLGFRETVRGSHHVFRHPTLPEKVNLQRDGGFAKVYQVRQVRGMLLRIAAAGSASAGSR
ncbi:MAG: type II toxin-antitoxin system HicA family toxin [Candidatus Binatia bacterium]